jgi:hypothetical protein
LQHFHPDKHGSTEIGRQVATIKAQHINMYRAKNDPDRYGVAVSDACTAETHDSALVFLESFERLLHMVASYSRLAPFLKTFRAFGLTSCNYADCDTVDLLSTPLLSTAISATFTLASAL